MQEADIHLARRLAIVYGASTGVLMLQSAVLALLTAGCAAWCAPRGWSPGVRTMLALGGVFVAAGAVALLAWLLRRWRRELERGRKPWPVRLPAWGLAVLIVVLCLAQRAIPYAHPGPLLSFSPYTAWNWVVFALFAASIQATLGINCFLWLWWCEPKPGNTRTSNYVFLAWLGLQVLWFILPPLQFLLYPSSQDLKFDALLHYAVLAQGSLGGGGDHWFLVLEMPGLFRLQSSPQVLLMCFFSGYAGRAIYTLLPRFRHLPAPPQAGHS